MFKQSAKRISSLANEQKYDPKLLSNITELLQTNRMESLASMFEATYDYYQRSIKKDADISNMKKPHKLYLKT